MSEWSVGLRMATADGTPSDVEYSVEASAMTDAVRKAVRAARADDPDLDYLDSIHHATEAGE